MMSTLGAFMVAEPALRGWLSERRVRRLLRRAGIEAVHDVFVSAPDGRRTQLDHVVFLGQKVAVIETKSIEGIVGRREGRWWRMLDGRERSSSGRTPQQQVLNAREVLMAAYPPWGRGVLGFVAVGLGALGEGLEGDPWVVGVDQLALALGRFRHVPDDGSLRRWRDLSRFLMANRRTGKDRLRFWREVVFHPSGFSRQQLIGFGCAVGGGMPLVISTAYYPAVWLSQHGLILLYSMIRV